MFLKVWLVLRLKASASPRNFLEVQNPRHHPRATYWVRNSGPRNRDFTRPAGDSDNYVGLRTTICTLLYVPTLNFLFTVPFMEPPTAWLLFSALPQPLVLAFFIFHICILSHRGLTHSLLLNFMIFKVRSTTYAFLKIPGSPGSSYLQGISIWISPKHSVSLKKFLTFSSKSLLPHIPAPGFLISINSTYLAAPARNLKIISDSSFFSPPFHIPNSSLLCNILTGLGIRTWTSLGRVLFYLLHHPLEVQHNSLLLKSGLHSDLFPKRTMWKVEIQE